MTHPAATSNPFSRFFRWPFVRLVTGFLAVMLPVLVIQLGVAALPLDRLVRNLLLALLTPPVAIWAYVTFVHLTERRQVTELGRGGAAKELGTGILLGASLLVIVIAILAVLGAFEVVGTGTPRATLIPFFLAVAGAPFEEIVFRGVLFRIIEQEQGSWLALAISAVIFGGLHLINENATVFGAIAIMLQAGLMLGAAFMATRRLWLPIGIHFAGNFVQSGIFGLAVSGNKAQEGLLRSSLTGPELLTGGAFGVEGSIVTIAAGLALTVVFLWLARKGGKIVQPRWRRPPA